MSETKINFDIFHPGYQQKGGDDPGRNDDGEQEHREERSERTKDSGAEGTAAETKKLSLRELALKYGRLYAMLQDRVLGQERVEAEFVEDLFTSELRAEEPGHSGPKAAFLFMGPSGVGKTYISRLFAQFTSMPPSDGADENHGTKKNRDEKCLVLDMSSYSQGTSKDVLFGIPGTYQASAPGIVTEFVRRNPDGIVVFDEIEKAHRDVIYEFLQILDRGRTTDGFTGEQIDFSGITIIMTTNAGKSVYEDRSRNFGRISGSELMQALETEKSPTDPLNRAAFPPEIVTRLASGNILLFNYLSADDLLGIIDHKFGEEADYLGTRLGLEITYDSRLPLVLLYGVGSEADARSVSSRASEFFSRELYAAARFENGVENFTEGLKKIRFEVDDENLSEQVRELLSEDENYDALILCDPSVKENLMKGREDSRFTFAFSMEEALSFMSRKNYTFIAVDPYAAKHRDNGIGLDDLDSDGIHFLKKMQRDGEETPLFILTASEGISLPDWNSLIRMGARGQIGIGESFFEEMDQQGKRVKRNTKAYDFMRRGYQMRYSSAQYVDKEQGILTVKIYDLEKIQAVTGDARQSLVKDAERPDVRFSDVIGAENAKAELREFKERFFDHPAKNTKGTEGILLYGPPGTGKTMLARAMAGETDVSFFQVSAADFLNRYVGGTEENIRKLFSQARKYAPSIIFIDEIDAIGKIRTGSEFNHASETALNTLLTQMEGFSGNSKHPVFVIAATNFGISGEEGKIPLDPALLRRFSNRIYVDLPTKEERLTFLMRVRSKKKWDLVTEDELKDIAERTPMESLAVLNGIAEFAERKARRENGGRVDDRMLKESLDEYRYGEKHEGYSEEYIHSVAIHESGHAYIAHLSGEEPSFITIVSRGDFGGYMQHEDNEHTPNYSREDLIWRIRTCLAGRAAETVFFGENSVNTGASSDLEHATSIAMNLLSRFGMGNSLVAMKPETILSTSLADRFYEKTNELLTGEMEETVRLVREGREEIEKLAERLEDQNSLTGEEIKAVWSR